MVKQYVYCNVERECNIQRYGGAGVRIAIRAAAGLTTAMVTLRPLVNEQALRHYRR